MKNPNEQEIRERAYRLWETEGCPDGREQEYWYRAEAELSGDGQQGDGVDSDLQPGGTIPNGGPAVGLAGSIGSSLTH